MKATGDKGRSRVRWAMLTVFIMAWFGAFVATHLPPDDISDIHMSDKTAHCIGYAVLATLLVGTLVFFGRTRLFRIVLTLGILLTYGAFDELTQPLFGRCAAFNDWLADAAGVVIALTLWETVLLLSAAFRSRNRDA